MLNVDGNKEMTDRTDNFKNVQGIGLYRIRYEMDVSNSSKDHSYVAGIVAYTSKEAVDTLTVFAKKRVKGFKGMRIDEVSFEGLCHELSDNVKDAVINRGIIEGKAVSKDDYEAALALGKKEAKKTSDKKSIIPKE